MWVLCTSRSPSGQADSTEENDFVSTMIGNMQPVIQIQKPYFPFFSRDRLDRHDPYSPIRRTRTGKRPWTLGGITPSCGFRVLIPYRGNDDGIASVRRISAEA